MRERVAGLRERTEAGVGTLNERKSRLEELTKEVAALTREVDGVAAQKRYSFDGMPSDYYTKACCIGNYG